MTTTVGDPTPATQKRCRACKRRGEWPGQPCPRCRRGEPPPPDELAELRRGAESAQLDELIEVINREGTRIQKVGGELLRSSIAAGEALLAAQVRVGRGDWRRWFDANVTTMAIDTAWRCMRIAAYKQEITDAGVNTLKAALAVVAGYPRRGQGKCRLTRKDIAELVDARESYDMSIPDLALAFNVSKSTVWKYVSEKSPDRADPEEIRRTPGVTEERVERVAVWLVERYRGFIDPSATEGPDSRPFPSEVTDTVRDEAVALLQWALDDD